MEDLPPLGGPGRPGRYELIQRIAVGGMAEVYRAYAVGPGDFRKLVAIKRLLPQHALDPQLLRMFLDESRLMARFAHPNLPHVLDVNDGGGADVPFFAMEHVAGVDLREILRAAAGPLPLEHVVALAAGVAAGLHHAHELRAEDGQPLQIVHRDVSPSNVLVSFDGGVKVTDFGVAKWLQQTSFTYQGQLKGKFAHMSPEQCRGEALDRRSDVFALGTLLYEIATGHPPFQADSEFELLSQIVSMDAPWPRGPSGELAPELAAIIMRSLHRNRDERFATAQEIQLAILSFAREQRLLVSPVGLAAYLESLFRDRVAAWRSTAGSNRTGAVPEATASVTDEPTATDAFALEATLVSRDERLPDRVEKPRPVARGRWPLAVGVSAVALLVAFGAYEATRPPGRAPSGVVPHVAGGAGGPAAATAPASTETHPSAPGTASVPENPPVLAKTAPDSTPGEPSGGLPPPAAPDPAGALESGTRTAGPRPTARIPRTARPRRVLGEVARVALAPPIAPPNARPAATQSSDTAAEPARPSPSPTPSVGIAGSRPVSPSPSPPRSPQTKVWDPDSPVPP